METQVYNYKLVRNFPTLYTAEAWNAAQNADSLMMNIHPDAMTDANTGCVSGNCFMQFCALERSGKERS